MNKYIFVSSIYLPVLISFVRNLRNCDVKIVEINCRNIYVEIFFHIKKKADDDLKKTKRHIKISSK